MKNRRGFTLVEIIVSLAIIGIIAIAMIPAFAVQMKITADTKNLTTGVFQAQADVEDLVYQVKSLLGKPGFIETDIDKDIFPEVTKVSNTIFGRSVDLYKLDKEFPLNPNKNFVVFLSKVLAINEIRDLLEAKDVYIEVSDNVLHEIADLNKPTAPTLIGHYNIPKVSEDWIPKSICRWYVSKEGNPDPIFPDDYILLTDLGRESSELKELIQYANRYIIFSATPVDIHGLRGKEVISNNRIYILGKEWRAAAFAWIDKNGDISFTDGTDVKIENLNAELASKWPLLMEFNADNKFNDPREPSNKLDPSGGNLYVPMNTNGLNEDSVEPVVVAGLDVINWTVDKGIHIASEIDVMNSSDVNLNAEDGSIIFYQYIDIQEGAVVFDSDGKAKTINYGSKITTASGDINLTTTGRGDVIMNEYCAIDSGNDIFIRPYGDIGLYRASLVAKGSISLDAAKGSLVAGVRDILIQDSQIALSGLNGTIDLNSRNNLTIKNSSISGSSYGVETLNVTAPDGITLEETDLSNLDTTLNNHASMKGGGWDSSSSVKVADGKYLTVATGYEPVDNAGQLILGKTGGLKFSGSLGTNLKNPVVLSLNKISDDQVKISTNYGRDISGSLNMEYSVDGVSVNGDASINCSFDNNDTIRISASGTGPISSYYKLVVQDKYAKGIKGSINFYVTAAEGGPPVVTVIGSELPTRAVTFDKNGGDTDPVPATINVSVGNKIGTLPTPPTKSGGYSFNGWWTAPSGGSEVNAETQINNNMTVYAQWIRVEYTVTFNGNNGTPSSQLIKVDGGTPIGAKLPSDPVRSGWRFTGWWTAASGGTKVDSQTIVNGDFTAYAQWSNKQYTVTFLGNGGTPNKRSVSVFEGTPIGTQLPSDPVRSGWRFTGWWTAASGGSKVDASTIVNSNLSVYAQWTKIYRVTFYSNGGSDPYPSTIDVVGGTPIGTLPTTSRRYWTFNGWWTTYYGYWDFMINEEYIVNEDLTVYARWTW